MLGPTYRVGAICIFMPRLGGAYCFRRVRSQRHHYAKFIVMRSLLYVDIISGMVWWC